MRVVWIRLLTTKVVRVVRCWIYFKLELAGFADGSEAGCEIE